MAKTKTSEVRAEAPAEMKVPFHHVDWGDEEVAAVMRSMKDNWFSPRGPALPEFGKRWAEFIGMEYAWPVSSGTAAIHLALLALGIGPGDYVAVPSYTCSPTVFPVSYVGAIPAFVDCDLETFGMCPDHLRRILQESGRGSIKAVIPTHVYGGACKKSVIAVAREYGLWVIEDACENAGGKYREPEWAHLYQGTQCDIGCFSFRGDKMLTTLGTGGAVACNSKSIMESIKYWSDLGLHNTSVMGRYRDLPVTGYNYEISNVAAAFGLAQIPKLPGFIEGRRRAAATWREVLDAEGGSHGVKVGYMKDYEGLVYYQFPIVFDRLREISELDELGEKVQARGVSLIPPFWPMSKQPMYLGIPADCPNAEWASEHVLLFPCYPSLKDEQIEYMAKVIVEEYVKIVRGG